MKNVLFTSAAQELEQFKDILGWSIKEEDEHLPAFHVLLKKMAKILSEHSENMLQKFLGLPCSFAHNSGVNDQLSVGELFCSIILYNEVWSLTEKNHGFFVLISDWNKKMPVNFKETVEILQGEMKNLSFKIFGEEKSFSFIKEVPPYPATERGESSPSAYAFRLDMKLLM